MVPVPVTNNGAGMNMATWVSIYQQWMYQMLAQGYKIEDLPKIAKAAGETFPKSLVSTVEGQNALFPGANPGAWQYDLDHFQKRSQPHNSLEGPKGYGEWQPMDPQEIQAANTYHAWKEDPKNAGIIAQYGDNPMNAYYAVQGGAKGPQTPTLSGMASSSSAGSPKGQTGWFVQYPNGKIVTRAQFNADRSTGFNGDLSSALASGYKSLKNTTAYQLPNGTYSLNAGDVHAASGTGSSTDKSGQKTNVTGSANPNNIDLSQFLPELSRSIHMDTLSQQFNLERAAQQYAEGVPIDKYLRDFYGQIMGVGFDSPTYSLTNPANAYVDMSKIDPGGNNIATFKPTNPANQDPNNPVEIPVRIGDAPDMPLEDSSRPDLAGGPPFGGGGGAGGGDHSGRPGQAGARSVTGADPYSGLSALYGRFGEMTPNAPGVVHTTADVYGGGDIYGMGASVEAGGGGGPNPGGQPNPVYDPNSGQMIYPDGTSVPFSSSATSGGGMYGFPSISLPNYNSAATYHPLGASFNPNNPSTWALLGGPAQGIASDMDSQLARITRAVPNGGEQRLAMSNAINQGYGSLASLRQNLVTGALGGLTNMSNQKLTGAPGGGNAGSTLTNLMGNQQQYNLGLQQLTEKQSEANKSIWSSILGSLGGALLGNPHLFGNG